MTGSGAPTSAMVYKLVARAHSAEPDAPLEPVAKKSTGKPSLGGRKHAYRRIDEDGVATEEVVATRPREELGRPLITPLLADGEILNRSTLAEARELHQRSLRQLPLSATQLSRGDTVIPTVYEVD